MNMKKNHGWTKERWANYKSWHLAYYRVTCWHRAALDIFDGNATD